MRLFQILALLSAVLGLSLTWAVTQQSRPVSAARGPRVDPKGPVAPEFPGSNSRWPDIAWGGNCYLVVWQEGGGYEGGADSNIYAARLSREGKPLDPKAIGVCQAKHHQLYPKVAFDGENFLVVWQDYRSGRDWDVYAARISPEGKLLDPEGFPIADGPGNQVHPSLDSDGQRVFVVWSDLRPNANGPERYVLAGTFVQGGKVEKPNGTVLSAYGRNGSLLGPIARWDGESFLIAAQHHPSGWDWGGPWLIRVWPTGKVEQLPANFQGESYTLACDPKTRRSCIWSFNRIGHGSYTCIFQTTLLPSGARHIVVGLPRNYSPINELWASATFDGKHFWIVSERGLDVPNNRSGVAIEMDLVAVRIDPQTGQPVDMGYVPLRGTDPQKQMKEVDAALATAPKGIEVAAEPGIFERQPALASSGDGRCALVYSRHAGPKQFVVHCVLLSE